MDKYPIVSIIEPGSPITESYRAIRTNIDFLKIDKDIKVINVTSAGAGEGKTTTIVNLATVFAQDNKKVLLIDLDLRKPKVHRYFEIRNKIGITDVLIKGVKIDDAIIKTRFGVHVMTSGSKTPYPAETISSKSFQLFIKEIRKDYDYILLDSPPLGIVTDAAIMTKCTDGTLIIVASGKTNKQQLKNVKNQLEKINGNIIGAILTKVPKEYTSYYGYNYQEYYGNK